MRHSARRRETALKARRGGCLQSTVIVLTLPSTLIVIGLLLVAVVAQYYPCVLSSKMLFVGTAVALVSATSGFCVGRFVGR